MAVVLRPMRQRDVPDAADLDRDLFGAEAWSAAMLRAELDDADLRHYIVAVDEHAPDDLLGYAGLATYDEEAHVLTVGVRAERQRQGIARLMVRHLIETAQRRGIRRMVLEVRSGSTGAQALYTEQGFRPVGIRRHYYQPSGDDAVVMVRE